ncbi:MAG: DUF1761 domain-containing protein [Terracidiphilus sp.]
MPMVSPHVRHNYLAIAVAAVASFLFEAIWYSMFLRAWLRGIGRDPAWLTNTGVSLGVQCFTAILAATLIATCISSFTQLTGPQTAVRGIKVAAGLWLGCVLTTFATESVFEVRSYQLFAINLGFWLLTMALMGAIVGGWKKKTASSQ